MTSGLGVVTTAIVSYWRPYGDLLLVRQPFNSVVISLIYRRRDQLIDQPIQRLTTTLRYLATSRRYVAQVSAEGDRGQERRRQYPVAESIANQKE